MRSHGTGCVMKMKGSRFWYIRYYVNGRQVRESTKSELRGVAEGLLRKRIAERDIQAAERLVKHPEGTALTLSKAEVRVLFNPCVYAFFQNGNCLYVGASKHGGARPFARTHERRLAMQEADRALIYPCDSWESALELEIVMIARHNPLLNQHREAPSQE